MIDKETICQQAIACERLFISTTAQRKNTQRAKSGFFAALRNRSKMRPFWSLARRPTTSQLVDRSHCKPVAMRLRVAVFTFKNDLIGIG